MRSKVVKFPVKERNYCDKAGPWEWLVVVLATGAVFAFSAFLFPLLLTGH